MYQLQIATPKFLFFSNSTLEYVFNRTSPSVCGDYHNLIIGDYPKEAIIVHKDISHTEASCCIEGDDIKFYKDNHWINTGLL